jgi:thioredoxin 1
MSSFKLFHVIESREEFDEAISKQGVCVVDFFGTWCGPCTNLAETLTSRATTDSKMQQATFIKVDVDEFSDLAELYNVSALPYLIFFKDGKLTEHFVKGNDPEKVMSIVSNLVK